MLFVSVGFCPPPHAAHLRSGRARFIIIEKRRKKVGARLVIIVKEYALNKEVRRGLKAAGCYQLLINSHLFIA